MPRINLPIPLGFYTSESLPLSSQRCINWIPTVSEGGALSQTALLQPSGLTEVASPNLGVCRGAWNMAGVPYFVVGNSLVSMSESGVITTHGAISGHVRVSFADNGTFLVIVVPGGDAYVFSNADSSLTQITDPDFQTSDSVVFYRGFFVFTTTDGKQLFVSNLNSPLTFDALDFGSAEGDPDRIVTQIVDHDELSIIGSKTTEVFRNIGGADFPLQIIQGAFTQKGAHTKYGVIKFDHTYMFIGGGENELTAIWRQSSSSSSVKVSTNAIDNEIQKFNKDEIANAFTMTFSKKGQFFAIFTFNSSRIPGKTFVYNATASALSGSPVWFEFQTGMDDAPWRVNAIVKAYGRLFCGDAIDGRIGELVDNVYTEYGNAVKRQG
ncbi:MAG: packaged DNA stabilization protein, partial [Gammaproteobacteria bacterium]